MSKKLLLLVLALFFLFSSTCFAEDKPLGEITGSQQVIDKVFSGRVLDPVEGIWFKDEKFIVAIVKSTVLYPAQKEQKYDYLFLQIIERGKIAGHVWSWGLKQTAYSFAFTGGSNNWKLLSPTILEHGLDFENQTWIRTYPTVP